VLNLANFRPGGEPSPPNASTTTDAAAAPGETAAPLDADNDATLDFLKRYLRLTHCDLFFADAAILVEGTAEKLLMSQMIQRCAPDLESRYVSVLEVGGAFAHKFSTFFEFLGIPYVVITDIDTVDRADKRKACRADAPEAHTSNASLRMLLKLETRDELVRLVQDKQVVNRGYCFVTYQRPVRASFEGAEHLLFGRTFEEAFIYENLDLFRDGGLKDVLDCSTLTTVELAKAEVYQRIRSESFKKTDFALGVASSKTMWAVPGYIREGLLWLQTKLGSQESAGNPQANAGASKK
jgi:hypothetical protein